MVMVTAVLLLDWFSQYSQTPLYGHPLNTDTSFPGGGGGVLPYKRLIGICRWMGSRFHDWSDYNGVAFSIELLEWGRTFSDFWGE